jgi:hypothetical protein
VRTFAALVFIAGCAAAAIWLARMPTVADGRVLEAEILPAFRGQGVTGLACERSIPVGRDGARFGCMASLGGGGRQRLACTLERDGRFACAPASGVMRDEPATGDPGEAPADPGEAPGETREAPGETRPPTAPVRRKQNAPPRDPWAN